MSTVGQPVRFPRFHTAANTDGHIARHNVLPEEFEEVCFGDALVLRAKSTGKNPVTTS
jgi:hypothetical protein